MLFCHPPALGIAEMQGSLCLAPGAFGNIPAIPLTGKQMLRITKREKGKEPVATLFFRFQNHGAKDLCLLYESFCGSWLLRPRKGTTCPCR